MSVEGFIILNKCEILNLFDDVSLINALARVGASFWAVQHCDVFYVAEGLRMVEVHQLH